MIPKQIYFIWFGNSKPNYLDFVTKSFSDVNPDFKIDTIFYSLEEIENFYKSKDDILIKSCIMAKNHVHFKNKYKNYLLVVSEIYRKLLITKYGGIYLDCDTFPIKPFDDKLLKLSNFTVSAMIAGENYLWKDIFFSGSTKDCNRKSMICLYPPVIYYNNDSYKIYRNKFFNMKLKYQEFFFQNGYIDHFQDNSWKKESREKCKYDIDGG